MKKSLLNNEIFSDFMGKAQLIEEDCWEGSFF